MGALDQTRPVRQPGESYAAFRARSRADYKFDPGIGDDGTDFKTALTPRLGGIAPTSGPLAQTGPQTHSWDTPNGVGQTESAVALRNLRNTGSLSGAIAAMPVTPPPPLFADVNDNGIPAPLGTNPPFSIQTGVSPVSATDMIAGNAPQNTSRFGMKSFNANGGRYNVLNTPYGNGQTFMPFRAHRPRNMAQASGLPF